MNFLMILISSFVNLKMDWTLSSGQSSSAKLKEMANSIFDYSRAAKRGRILLCSESCSSSSDFSLESESRPESELSLEFL